MALLISPAKVKYALQDCLTKSTDPEICLCVQGDPFLDECFQGFRSLYWNIFYPFWLLLIEDDLVENLPLVHPMIFAGLTNPDSECLNFKAMHDGVKVQKEKCTKVPTWDPTTVKRLNLERRDETWLEMDNACFVTLCLCLKGGGRAAKRKQPSNCSQTWLFLLSVLEEM